MNIASRVRKRRAIRTLSELDDFFGEFTHRRPSLDDIGDEGIAELLSVYYAPKNLKLPRDPRSESYRDAQWELFLNLRGKSYDLADEGDLDFQRDCDNFYPYSMRSSRELGQCLLYRGTAIREMGITANSKVVEFGSGTGNITIDLAMLGCDVLAVEPNPEYRRLIEYRAGKHGKPVRFSDCDMLDFARTNTEHFDVALFAASFHHCRDHVEMLRLLSTCADTICFSNEPIMYANNPFLPYPWGVRLDGQSLFFIRQHGWLELGFQESYFRKALAMCGFKLRRVQFPGLADLFIATKLAE